MALSNIGREPRREITEQIAGTLALALYVVAAYLVVTEIFGATRTVDKIFGTFFFGLVMLVVIPGLIFSTHAIGEVVCDWLKAARIDPRPRQRY